MIYEFNPKIVNRNKPKDFYTGRSFVGYILPNGDIVQFQNHNISDAETSLLMYLDILDNDYANKDKFLNGIETNNKLAQFVINHLKRMSHDEIHALLEYIHASHILLSDLLVYYFGCHLITRLDKEILTSENNYMCFYNYLLNDFKITNVGKLLYDGDNKRFIYVKPMDRNEYLYDEIKRIKNEVGDSQIDLFYKSR